MKRLLCAILTGGLLLGLLPMAARAEEPEIPGKAWCLMDAATGKVLRAHNEHEPLPPASVTKIMTLLLIMEAVDSGVIRWDTPVTASETAAGKGGSQIYLKAGETMPVSDMVKSIAVSSANDCACAMAELLAGSEQAFADRMNEKAKALGMNDTHFVNCTGLDDGPDAADHKTSALDIALMSRELLTRHPDIKKYTTIWMDSVRGGSFGLANTNKLVRFYPGCTGLKTGFTASAGFCLSASACRENLELIAVVLGCASSRERFAACRKLLDFGFAGYALYTEPLPQIPPVPVRLGTSETVLPVPAEAPKLLSEKAKIAQITVRTELPQEIPAPVEKGAVLGRLLFSDGERELLSVPLIAPEAVGRLGFPDLFRRILGIIAMGNGL